MLELFSTANLIMAAGRYPQPIPLPHHRHQKKKSRHSDSTASKKFGKTSGSWRKLFRKSSRQDSGVASEPSTHCTPDGSTPNTSIQPDSTPAISEDATPEGANSQFMEDIDETPEDTIHESIKIDDDFHNDSRICDEHQKPDMDTENGSLNDEQLPVDLPKNEEVEVMANGSNASYTSYEPYQYDQSSLSIQLNCQASRVECMDEEERYEFFDVSRRHKIKKLAIQSLDDEGLFKTM